MKKLLLAAVAMVGVSACAAPYPYEPYDPVMVGDEYVYTPNAYTYSNAYITQPNVVRRAVPSEVQYVHPKVVAPAPVTTVVAPAPVVAAPASVLRTSPHYAAPRYTAPRYVVPGYNAPQVVVPVKEYNSVYR